MTDTTEGQEQGQAILSLSAPPDFEREVLGEARPVLVDFYADWCGPCRALAPVLEEVARERAGLLKVVKLNVDENEALSAEYGVQAIPTLILFVGGREAERWVGFLPKARLLTALDRALEPYLPLEEERGPNGR